MLVNFKRDFFGPDGKFYERGTREYNGAEETLPRDALIVDKNGHIPVSANTPKAGFGAKPLEEQVLDLIPGAGETHQILQADAGSAPVTDLSEDERKEIEAKSAKLARQEREDAEKQNTEEAKELAKDVKQGVANAEKAAEQVKESTDPLSPFNSPSKKK